MNYNKNLTVKTVEIGITKILSNSDCPGHIVSHNRTRTINALGFMHNISDLHRLYRGNFIVTIIRI